ncbi:MAG: histidine kinase, partial [Calditrichota bacterium]
LWQLASFGTLYLIMGNSLFSIMDVRTIAGWQYPQGLLIYLMVAGIYYTLLFYYEVKERELRESRLLLSLRESEWKALKAQINPHFLFNALNSVSALISQDSNKAREMLVKLSTLLRRALSENPLQTTQLENELSFTHHYLELEKIRLGDRLTYSENISPDLQQAQVPVMLLQPLIENAIKHGINPVSSGGFLEITIEKNGELLKGYIRNSTPDHIAKTDSGSGLKNLTNRLELLYGNKANIYTSHNPDQNSFTATFLIPLQTDVEEIKV